MNPLAILPASFNHAEWQLNKLVADGIPAVTVDHTRGQHFCWPFSLQDIEHTKEYISKNSAKSAKGIDDICNLHSPTGPVELLMDSW